MRGTTIAAALAVGSLLGVAGVLALTYFERDREAGTIAVRFVTDPPGAVVRSADGRSVFGSAPTIAVYTKPTTWEACASFPGVVARWPDGRQMSVNRLELCPQAGVFQEVRITIPKTNRRRPAVAPTPTAPTVNLATEVPAAYGQCGPVDAASRVSVKRAGVSLYARPEAGSDSVLDTLSADTLLDVSHASGEWLVVRFQHASGERIGYVACADVVAFELGPRRWTASPIDLARASDDAPPTVDNAPPSNPAVSAPPAANARAASVSYDAQRQKIMIFGGSNHDLYLGCLDCPASARDSIFNKQGEYGHCEGADNLFCRGDLAKFASTGGFNKYSACASGAADPPVIADQLGTSLRPIFRRWSFWTQRRRLLGVDVHQVL